jgi:hypothetical protein
MALFETHRLPPVGESTEADQLREIVAAYDTVMQQRLQRSCMRIVARQIFLQALPFMMKEFDRQQVADWLDLDNNEEGDWFRRCELPTVVKALLPRCCGKSTALAVTMVLVARFFDCRPEPLMFHVFSPSAPRGEMLRDKVKTAARALDVGLVQHENCLALTRPVPGVMGVRVPVTISFVTDVEWMRGQHCDWLLVDEPDFVWPSVQALLADTTGLTTCVGTGRPDGWLLQQPDTIRSPCGVAQAQTREQHRCRECSDRVPNLV